MLEASRRRPSSSTSTFPVRHRGVFNRKASKAFDEIILTEGIIDALSLIALGLENVQACYGVNGFTEEHLEILKADRVKTVIIAFDNDEPGRKASEEPRGQVAGGRLLGEADLPRLQGLE